MTDLTKTQSSALFRLFEAGTPLTIPKKTATALLDTGMAQIARVSPKPTDGLALAITVRGRSYCLRQTEPAPVEDEPADQPDDTDTDDLVR